MSFDFETYYVLRGSIISASINHFKEETAIWISNALVSISEVEIAINEDINDVYKNNISVLYQYKSGQIEQYTEQQPHITSSSPHINDALMKVVNLINDDLFSSIESLLYTLSQSKRNNFNWKKDKEQILGMA